MSVEDAERSMGSVSVERRWVLRVLWVGRVWCVVGAERAAWAVSAWSGAQVGAVHSGVVWAVVVEPGVLVSDWRVGPRWLRRGQRQQMCSSSLHQPAVGLC